MKYLFVVFLSVLISVVCRAENPVLASGDRIIVSGAGALSPPELRNSVLGCAYVYRNTRPDLFVSSIEMCKNGVRVPERLRKTVVRIYPWVKDQGGVPMFGTPAECTHSFDVSYQPKYVFQRDGESVFCVWVGRNDMILSRLDMSNKTFVEVGKTEFKLSGFGSGSAMTLLPNPDGTETLLYAQRTGDYQGTENRKVHPRGPFFDPFDGEGIWRGDLTVASLRSAGVDAFFKSAPANDRTVSDEVSFSFGRSLCVVNLGAGHERDVIGGGQFGVMHHYRNKSETGIDFDPMRYVVGTDETVLRHPTIDASPIQYPNAQSGFSDMISLGEGWVYYYCFTGKFSDNGSPVYDNPVPVLQLNPPLNLEPLPVINLADWNGDGLIDIVSGSSPGFVVWAENIGSIESPVFSSPLRVTCAGEPIHKQPGYRGSIQGPVEARWGYSCPRVADWDGNGLPDILMSGSPATFEVYMNDGTSSEPVFNKVRSLYVDGLDLHGTWRVQPAVGRMGEKTAYICLDDDDEFHLYWRIDNFNLEDGGKLRLQDGRIIQANYRSAGGSGRLKMALVDWDSDGKSDLLLGTMCDHSVPSIKQGLPNSLQSASAVLLMRNVGTDEEPCFENPRLFNFQGRPRFFGVHSCSPAAEDINGDGKKDLLVGEESGGVFFYDHDDVIFAEVDLSRYPIQCRWQKGCPDDNWHNPLNWWRGVPRITDQAIISDPASIKLYGQPSECLMLLIGSRSDMAVESNDVLTVANDLTVGPYAGNNAVLKVGGGEVNIGGNLVVGKNQNSLGTLFMSGGIITANGLLVGAEGGHGEVEIRGGEIRLHGDKRSVLREYLDRGRVAAASPGTRVSVRYDSAETQTVISVY